MKHQVGDGKTAEFFLRVKFYEPEPSKLQDDYMRLVSCIYNNNRNIKRNYFTFEKFAEIF